MSSNDVFALDRSGFNGFLFAAIGIEANGNPLTVLSALARLGDDPWLRAASWARMSKAAAGEALAACIAQMPVTPEDLAARSSTAARLVLLLSPVDVERKPDARLAGPHRQRKVMAIMLLIIAVSALLFGALFSLAPSGPAAQPPAAAAASSASKL